MDLFDYMREANMKQEAPLASRLRPATLEEVVGQEHIIGKNKLLYRAIKADKLSSLIFYGPPGTGKTTLAQVIANTTSAQFTQMNATVAGKKDMEEVVANAKASAGMYGKKTILFIDEITRINDLDYNFHKLLDHYKLVGTKIICAGTDSYLLSLSQQDTALGRLHLIRFLPILFEDLKAIDDSLTFKAFCLNGKMFTNDNQATIIANNIFHSIDRSVSSKNTLQGEQIEDIKDAIMLLIELLLGAIRNKLPALKIKIVYSKYIIEEQKFFEINNINKDMVNAVFNILITLNAIDAISRYSISMEEDEYTLVFKDKMFYCTLPMLYHSVLNILTGESLYLTQTYMGTLFEATAITQLEQKIRVSNLTSMVSTFSIREDIIDTYEIDYCIIYDNRVLSLIEFKVNAKKTSKWFYHPAIVGFCTNFEIVNRYIIYLEGESSNNNTDIQYIHIEDFLKNLTNFIS